MRQEMQDWLVCPLALIHVIGVFRESREIDDAKVGTDGGPRIRRRFANVIPPSPNKHARQEVVLLHNLPRLFMGRSPRGAAIVVSRTCVIGISFLELLVIFAGPASDLV